MHTALGFCRQYTSGSSPLTSSTITSHVVDPHFSRCGSSTATLGALLLHYAGLRVTLCL
jgi:hypothetical protein